jgi:hypothetical protein
MRCLAHAFRDPRYIRFRGKPLFLVYRASHLPDAGRTTNVWREEAHKSGIGEIFLCRVESYIDELSDPADLGFDASVEFQPDWQAVGQMPLHRGRRWRLAAMLGMHPKAYWQHRIFAYADLVRSALSKSDPGYLLFPCVTPSWDNSPRRKADAVVFNGSDPEMYGRWLKEIVRRQSALERGDHLVFINAWNEWGEGNHLEPDLRHGLAYLRATQRALEAR